MFLRRQGGGIQQTKGALLLRGGRDRAAEHKACRDISIVYWCYDLRGEEEGEGSVEEEELYFLQLAQMVVILVSLMSV